MSNVPHRPPGHTRAAVAHLLAQGASQAEIGRQLRISKPTVCFHVRRIGIPARAAPANRYDWGEIRNYYEAGHSATECRRQFGFSRNAWADAINRGAIISRPRLEPIDDVLAAGRRRCRQHVKIRLLLAGLKHPNCELCGLEQWQGQPLSLELHHINGDGQDNRLENLRLLCPNCHSQTDTWGGRNKARRAAADSIVKSLRRKVAVSERRTALPARTGDRDRAQSSQGESLASSG